MAKFDLKIKARKSRARGESVRDISLRLGISKSTVSLWVRDIILSVEQFEKLRQKRIKGGELGRLKGALMQKQRRLDLISRFQIEGVTEFTKLSERELLIAGLSLYWAEGSKKDGRIQFCNSDPKLIKFMIRWLDKNFDIGIDRLKGRVAINETHRKREQIVKEYWSKISGISLDKFKKTSFKKSKAQKIYENHNEHFGTFDVCVLKPGGLYYKILGLIHGLSLAG